MAKVNQPNLKPTSKVAAGGAAGLIVTAVIAVLSLFGVDVPVEVGDAALAVVAGGTTIVMFVASYMKREKL